MFLHYLKIAWRNIWNDKFYSLINLVGLTVAFTVVFLFVQWIRFELSFENCYLDADRIYQIQESIKRSDGVYNQVHIRPPVHKELKERYPIIEEIVLLSREKSSWLETENPVQFDIIYGSTNFLKVFPMECVEGTTASLETKDAVLFISEEAASRIYGSSQKAIGKNYELYSKLYPIEGVLRVPANTMIQFEVLLLWEDGSMNYNGGMHYMLLKDNVSLTLEIEESIANYLSERYETENKLRLQPLRQLHLHTDDRTWRDDYFHKVYYGNIKEINTFIVIIVLLLLLSIINYVNTSIARAMSRLREVGVRKISGSSRQQLIFRFLIEAFIISSLAVFLAVDIAKILHYPFENIMGNIFLFNIDSFTILLALSLSLITTLLAGGYAAFYLSSRSAASVLVGGGNERTGYKKRFRKILLGIQFVICIGVLVCTWTVYRQLDYMLNKDLGFNRENIYIQNVRYFPEFENYIFMLKGRPYIINATAASDAPYNIQLQYSDVSWEGSSQGTEELNFIELSCDSRYAETFGLQVLQGNFIQPNLGWRTDITEETFDILINESFRRLMGMENPLGTTVKYGLPGYNTSTGKIIGVVKDFYFRPMNYEVSPLIIRFSPGIFKNIYIKTDTAYEKDVLESIENTWNEFISVTAASYLDTYPGYSELLYSRPFLLKSMDVDYAELYKSETRLQKILVIFSLLSLVLSLMGIISMVAFIIEKRTKEIGIRKINGARWLDIVREFWREFMLLLGIATAPALLLSYWFMHVWLQQYVYHAAFGWWIYILMPLIIFVLTMFILFFQVQGIARRNPVESLKSE